MARKNVTASVVRAKLESDPAERFLMVTYIGQEREYSVPGIGVVSRKIAENLTDLFGYSAPPMRYKGEKPLVPQEDGLFPGFSQTWRVED